MTKKAAQGSKRGRRGITWDCILREKDSGPTFFFYSKD
jgi:hypothetical protein